MKISTKRIIAKEVIIFISGLAITILSLLLVFPYNYVQDVKIKNLIDQAIQKRKKAEILIKEYRKSIEKLYYQVQPSSLYMDKEKFILIASEDTMVFNKVSDIIFNEPSYKSIVYKALKETFLDFNKIENEFIVACSDTAYVKKVYLVLKQEFSNFDSPWTEFCKCMFIDHPGFRNKHEYDKYIRNLRENYIKSIELTKDSKILEFKIVTYKSKILTTEEHIEFGVRMALIIIIILFPIRYLYLLTVWSLKILRQKEKD